MDLVRIHQEVIAKLKEKYGDKKIKEVDALSPDVVMAVSTGVEVPGVTDEQREIIYDFNEMIVNHPLSNCTKSFVRPKRILN